LPTTFTGSSGSKTHHHRLAIQGVPNLLILALSVSGDSGFTYTAEHLVKAPVDNILKAIRLAGRGEHSFPA
jgi:hypothetical protein